MIISFWSVKGSPRLGSLFPTLPVGSHTINHPCTGCYGPSLRFFVGPLRGKKSNCYLSKNSKGTRAAHFKVPTQIKKVHFACSLCKIPVETVESFFLFPDAHDVWHIWEYVFKLIYQNWDEMVSWRSGYKIQDANLSYTHFNAVPESEDL